MNNVEIKLYINESVKPVHQSHGRIPSRQGKNLEVCMESLLKEDCGTNTMGLPSCSCPEAQTTRQCSTVCRHEGSQQSLPFPSLADT